jgi:precorrin-2 dehydrogenase/sirohydrochlorin ferrochelatase
VLTNVADAPDRCDFIVPSVVERGELTIAVSTGGSSPAVARKIRKELEALYGEEYSELLRIMGKLRETIIAEGRDSDENREKFELLACSDILDCIREGRMADADAIIERLTGVGMEVKKG